MKKKLFVIYEKQDDGKIREAYAKTKIVASNMLNFMLKHKYLDHYCAWCKLRKLTTYDEATWQMYISATHPGKGIFATSVIKVDRKDQRYKNAMDEKRLKNIMERSVVESLIETALHFIDKKKKEENKA